MANRIHFKAIVPLSGIGFDVVAYNPDNLDHWSVIESFPNADEAIEAAAQYTRGAQYRELFPHSIGA